MMKKITSLLLAMLLLMTVACGLTAHAATGSLTATTSASSVTVGNSVTITLKYDGSGAKIASVDSQINYNAKAFEYVSCDGGAANGGAGVVRVSYYATGAATTTATFTLKFKAIAAGSGDFSVSTSDFYNDDDYTSLGTPSKTLAVAAINPTLSSNANLASIKPSSGTLTPKFSANVTNYTIAVPYTTTSLSLSATTQDTGAKIAVSGSNKLNVGNNTQVITVTAPNGTTKKYTVVINRSANQTTRPAQTTTPPAQENPLEVSVDGVLMNVSDTQPTEELPTDFSWTHITINDVAVSAAVNQTTNITLVYLTNVADDTSAFYIFNNEQGLFHVFCPLAVNGGNYVLLDMPAEVDAPAGAVAGTHIFGTIERDVWIFEDEALSNVCLVYATSPAGKTGLYMYDTEDGSMQFYREITIAADAPPTSTTAPTNAFVGFINQNRTVILICAAAAGGLALLIAAVILLISITRGDNKGKH